MQEAQPERAPPSPCIGVCEIDPGNRFCKGCLRSVAEVAAWFRAGAAEKRAILARIEERRRETLRDEA